MSDEHVVALHYQFLSANEMDRFTKAIAVTVTADDFDLHLEDGRLTARPHAHYATIDQARAGIEPYLRSWSAHASLERARRDIRFEFEDADVVDRSDAGKVFPSVARGAAAAANASILVDNGVYPTPPSGFRTDDVLDSILMRLAEVDAHRSTITAETYWVVTRIEGAYGSGKGSDVRKTAARTISVEPRVLAKMAELATRNDPAIGRKGAGAPQPLDTDREGLDAGRDRARRGSDRHRQRRHGPDSSDHDGPADDLAAPPEPSRRSAP
jgi:hypothetical protein